MVGFFCFFFFYDYAVTNIFELSCVLLAVFTNAGSVCGGQSVNFGLRIDMNLSQTARTYRIILFSSTSVFISVK